MSELTQAVTTALEKPGELSLADVIAQTGTQLAWRGLPLTPELRAAWAKAQPFEWDVLVKSHGNMAQMLRNELGA